jgi:hypothetical protein
MVTRSTAAVRLLPGDKEPVRLASTANLSLSGLPTIDGFAALAGDRILVKDQSNPVENGIYTANEGGWRRAPDCVSSRSMIAGMKVTVQEGTAHGGDVWNLNTNRPNIGTDPIQYSLYLNTNIADEINAAREALVAEMDAIIATAMSAGKATQAEAEAGVSNVGWMTPLRTRQAFAKTIYLMKRREGIFNVEDYGAIGDGLDSSSSINASAFANTIADIGSNGGRVIIPPGGRFHTNDYLVNALHKSGIEFVGVGSGNGQETKASTVVFTADGSAGGLIRLDATQAIAFRRINLLYNHPNFVQSAPLINLRAQVGEATAGTIFEECGTGGTNNSSKKAIIFDVARSYGTEIRGGYHRNAYSAIVGAREANQSDWCNNFTVCQKAFFDITLTAPIIAGGERFVVDDIIAEPSKGATGGADLRFMFVSPWGVNGFSITRSAFFDAANNTGVLLNFGLPSDFGPAGYVRGLVLNENRAQLGNSSAEFLDLGRTLGGVIMGNLLTRNTNGGSFCNGSQANGISAMGNRLDTNAVGPTLFGQMPHASFIDNCDGLGPLFRA